MKSGLVSVNTARQVNVAQPKTTVNAARPMSYLSKIAHSTVKRPIQKNTAFTNSNVTQKVNTIRSKTVNTARPKAVVSAVLGNRVNAVKASAWNMSYLTDYEEIDERYVAFGGNPKRGKITRKGTKDETSGILKSFIKRIENLVDHKVKVIRCDNEAEFKNREINQFCEMKEVVNTSCYVQNRVFVVKPHNKTPYELFHGRTPTLSFMRPFGCLVTILNTKDHLGKFDCKADEGFFIGYSLNSKAFRVFDSRTRIVEENLHIRFSENTPNVVSSGPDWIFDIDALTRTMNYELLVAGTQFKGFIGTKESDNADLKSSQVDRFKPSSDNIKNVDKDPSKGSECKDQKKQNTVNSTNNVNTVSSTINVVGTNELPFDPDMPALGDIGTFNFSNEDEDDGEMHDMNNLEITIQVSPTPTTRIHKDHHLDQVIGDLDSAIQTRNIPASRPPPPATTPPSPENFSGELFSANPKRLPVSRSIRSPTPLSLTRHLHQHHCHHRTPPPPSTSPPLPSPHLHTETTPQPLPPIHHTTPLPPPLLLQPPTPQPLSTIYTIPTSYPPPPNAIVTAITTVTSPSLSHRHCRTPLGMFVSGFIKKGSRSVWLVVLQPKRRFVWGGQQLKEGRFCWCRTATSGGDSVVGFIFCSQQLGAFGCCVTTMRACLFLELLTDLEVVVLGVSGFVNDWCRLGCVWVAATTMFLFSAVGCLFGVTADLGAFGFVETGQSAFGLVSIEKGAFVCEFWQPH
nr:retrovirus-related Pol polyprotein from transposon TNT 1-94 [Tanacetum cinerariifolium]